MSRFGGSARWTLSVLILDVQPVQQELQVEQIQLPNDVGKEHVSFLILTPTFHHQLAQVELVEPCQVQDVMVHQVVVARTNCHCLDLVCFVGPNFFPSIIRSICVCREIKERAVWQTSDKVLEAHGFSVCDIFWNSARERMCRTVHRTREVSSVIQTTPFIRTPSAVVSHS